jgi:hypothetical protein
VRTARRRYFSSKEVALCVLLVRLAMHSRVEDLEKRFFRSKAAITEIFYEALECFLLLAGPLVSTFQADFLRTRAEYCSSKISEKSENATQNCAGFIERTLIEIANACRRVSCCKSDLQRTQETPRAQMASDYNSRWYVVSHIWPV